jgi:polysaccharide export outer membrane protein
VPAAVLVCTGALLVAVMAPAAPWIDVTKPLDVDYSTSDPTTLPAASLNAQSIAEEAAAGDHAVVEPVDPNPRIPPATEQAVNRQIPVAPAANPPGVKAVNALHTADGARPVAQRALVEDARVEDAGIEKAGVEAVTPAPVTARKSPQMMAVPGSRATLADAIDDAEGMSVDGGGAAPLGASGTSSDMAATAPVPATGSTNRAPIAYVPPGARYQVQPGDILQITVWKEEDLQREVLVRPDGGISFPLAGDVAAAGRTVDQVQEELAAKIESYIPEPVVTVAVKQVVGNRVYVVGRVNKPGEIIMGHELTVMQALSLAGGVTPFAALNKVHVLRRDQGVERSIPFRYGDVEKGRSLSQNIVLQNGDVVVVP